MEIKDLKQPYKRMAEYYRIIERSELTGRIEFYILDEFPTPDFNNWFWTEIKKGNHPEITEEIKQHFPADFDFSGEEQPLQLPNNPIIQNRIYTKLAKEGRFDELPETCEFSEPVELEVGDDELSIEFRKITGKFKGNYMDIHCIGWNFAQLPTKKIDFSDFKTGDVVEVELTHNEKRIGWFDYVNNNHLVINVLKRKGNQVCNGGSCAGSKMLNKEKIKSITKIK